MDIRAHDRIYEAGYYAARDATKGLSTESLQEIQHETADDFVFQVVGDEIDHREEEVSA